MSRCELNYEGKPLPKIDKTKYNFKPLTENAKVILKDRYVGKDEVPEDIFERVARYYADNDEHAQRIYDYISKMYFMPATPILANGGTTRGLPISCFLNECEDSLDSIANLWNENVFLASSGGGIGSYIGNVRSINEPIKNKGFTSGIVPFLKVIDSMTLAISQGSLRRGSAATYLKIDHPEIEEFIDIRRPNGGDHNRRCMNIHHGVVITDDFMNAVENGLEWELKSPATGAVMSTISARELWIKLLNARIETGEPYLLFIDTVNKSRPEHQKKLGLTVKTSNLCVAPETLILVKDIGWVEIQSVTGKEVEVWNGFEWSLVVPKKTGENQNLLKVKTNDGQELECTHYHKWFIQEFDALGKAKKSIIKQTNELKVGDKIIKCDFPLIEGLLNLELAYANGFYSGDGCKVNRNDSYKHARIYLYADKIQCEDRLNLSSYQEAKIYIQEKLGRKYINLPIGILKDKFFTPNASYTIKSRLDWFAGVCDSDGCISRNGSNQQLQIANINKQFLLNIQKMLQELGCKSRISFFRKGGKYLMSKNNGTKDLHLYNCQPIWRILINSNELYKLSQLGLFFTRLKYNPVLPKRRSSHFICIDEIIDANRISDTYCFTEPKRNSAVFNGIITSQCSEITLPTGIDHLGNSRTAVCCLSSVNLEYYEIWEKDENFIPDIMRFLDNILEDFIRRAPDGMSRAKYSAMRERSVGLGVMGFHSFLQSKMIPIESVVAKSWNLRIFKHIKSQCDKSSIKLAKERGACPDAKECGIEERFSNKIAIAPTANISTFCDQVSPGIEPYAANVFTQKTLSGSFVVKNKYLEKLIKQKNRDTEEVWSSISVNNGSVKHLNFLTDDEKNVFATGMEINQRWLVSHAIDRTPFICQAQSFNVFFPANISKKELHAIHFEGWKKGIKSFYYCRSMSIQRADKASDSSSIIAKSEIELNLSNQNDECIACQ